MKIKAALLGLAVSVFSFGSIAGEAACTHPDGVKFSARDTVRLERLEISRTIGLAAALRSASIADRDVVAILFEKGFQAIQNPNDLIGRYQCRTIKLGGLGPSVVYGWFSCEIFPEEAALILRKTSGSQRFFGLLHSAGNGLAYRGALHYGHESDLKFYGDDPERDQVGCLSEIANDPGHLVLELPEPVFESQHDVIELVRVQ